MVLLPFFLDTSLPPPPLSLLPASRYSPPAPLTLSPPSSAFTFQESPDFPISSFPQLARKSVHAPPLQRYLRALQKGPSSLTSISVLYRPTADDQRGRLYPLAVGASKLSRHYRALLFGRSHVEIDITGSHYQFFQRFSLSLLDISLPTVDRLRALLSEDFIASNSRFLEQYPTAPKDLPTILLNSSLESTLLYYRGKGYWPSHQVRALLLQISQTKPRLLAALNQSLGPRTLSSLTSANLCFHTMEHPETLWLKSFTSYILSHHSTSSLIWLHDGIWLAPPPPSSLITAANLHATSALNLGDRPLLIKIRPCSAPGNFSNFRVLLPLTLLPLHPYRLPHSTLRCRKSRPDGDSSGWCATLWIHEPSTPSPLLKSFIWMINYDRPFIVYIPIYLRIRSLEVNVAALMNVGLLLYITHNWLVSHRYYLAVCFWSASFRIPPSLRLFNTVVRRFAASIRMLPLKGARKVRIRARTRVAIKARVKGKVMIGKVDRSRSPPFRLVLGWAFHLLLTLHYWHALAPARLFCLPLSHLVTVISPLLSFFWLSFILGMLLCLPPLTSMSWLLDLSYLCGRLLVQLSTI